MTPHEALLQQLGSIDLYLLDQILRGRIAPGARILDAGCGSGRNLRWLLEHGYNVHALDESAAAVARTRELAAALAPDLPSGNFRVERVQDASFAPRSFDVVLSIAVLHFMADEAEFGAALRAMFALLKPGGLFFARLAMTTGVEPLLRPAGARSRLPDGTEWLLHSAADLERWTRELGAELLDPIKSVVVHGQRAMGVWVARI